MTGSDTAELAALFTYFGHDLNPEKAEVLALTHIQPKLLKLEAKLYRTKWFDHRHLHPTEATYLFAKCYDRAVKRAHGIHRDYRDGKDIKGFKGRDIFKLSKALITGFWTARQKADELGIPYPLFTEVTVEFALACGWERMPQAAQLVSTDYLMEEVLAMWNERCNMNLQIAERVFFTAEEYEGHPRQNDYYEWIINQIQRRPTLPISLSYLVFQRRILPEAIAIDRFGADMVSRAEELTRRVFACDTQSVLT